MLDLQERTKKNSKLATQKISKLLNTQQQRKEHDKAVNATKNNGTSEIIEEFEKFHQNSGRQKK